MVAPLKPKTSRLHVLLILRWRQAQVYRLSAVAIHSPKKPDREMRTLFL